MKGRGRFMRMIGRSKRMLAVLISLALIFPLALLPADTAEAGDAEHALQVVKPSEEGVFRYTKTDAVPGKDYAVYVVDGIDRTDNVLNWDSLTGRLRYTDQKRAEGKSLTFDIPQKETSGSSTLYIGDSAENRNYAAGFLSAETEVWVCDITGEYYYSDAGFGSLLVTEYRVTSEKSWEELKKLLPESAYLHLQPVKPGTGGTGGVSMPVPVNIEWQKPDGFTEFKAGTDKELIISASVSVNTDSLEGRTGAAWAAAYPVPDLKAKVTGPDVPGPKPAAYHRIIVQGMAGAYLSGAMAYSAVSGDEILIRWERNYIDRTSLDGYEFVSWDVTGAVPADPASPQTAFTMGDSDVIVKFRENKVLIDYDVESPETEPENRDKTTKVSKLKFGLKTVTVFSGRSTANPAVPAPPKGAAMENIPAVTYVTGNKDIVTVGKDGTFYAKAPGETMVTAFCGNKKAACKVNVVNPTEKLIIFDENGKTRPDAYNKDTFYVGWEKDPERTIILNAGEKMALRTAVYPSDSTDPRNVTWKVVAWPSKDRDKNGNLIYRNDSQFLSVKNGILTAKEAIEPNSNPILVSATVKKTVTDPKTGKLKNADLTSMVQVYVFPMIADTRARKDDQTHTLSVKKSVNMVTAEGGADLKLEIAISSKLKNDSVSENYEITGCESSNPKVVSVKSVSGISVADNKGRKGVAVAELKANAPGTAYIIVKSKNKNSASPNLQYCKVTVTSPAEAVSAESGTLEIKSGQAGGQSVKMLTMRKGSCGTIETLVNPSWTTDLGSLKIAGSGGVKVKKGVIWASSLTKPENGKYAKVTVSCGKKAKDTVFVTVVQ